jgi:hypothetical protein
VVFPDKYSVGELIICARVSLLRRGVVILMQPTGKIPMKAKVLRLGTPRAEWLFMFDRRATMRTVLLIATLLLAPSTLAAAPALSSRPKADARPATPMPAAPKSKVGKPAVPPPSPPPIEWVVEGYKAVGLQWVKQPDHCLKTTDLKQANEYQIEIMRFQDWLVRSNVPALCSVLPSRFESPIPMETPEEPPAATFTVWVFHLQKGQWIKAPKYCWTTGGYRNCRLDALAYAEKVNALAGWCATTNAPETTQKKTTDKTLVFHGPLGWHNTTGYYNRRGRGSSSNDDSWVRDQWEADRRQDELNDTSNRLLQEAQQMHNSINETQQFMNQNNNP